MAPINFVRRRDRVAMRLQGLLVVGLAVGLAACSPNANPSSSVSPVAGSAAPTLTETAAPPTSPEVSIDCGSLGTDSCHIAVTVALGALPGACRSPGRCGPALALRIESPAPGRTCPPSGGPGPDSHICEVIAVVTTTNGDVLVGLEPTDGGWIWSGEIR